MARLNKHGAYICTPCCEGDHLGVHHGGSQYALCQCSCDGVHDKRGRLIDDTKRARAQEGRWRWRTSR